MHDDGQSKGKTLDTPTGSLWWFIHDDGQNKGKVLGRDMSRTLKNGFGNMRIGSCTIPPLKKSQAPLWNFKKQVSLLRSSAGTLWVLFFHHREAILVVTDVFTKWVKLLQLQYCCVHLLKCWLRI